MFFFPHLIANLWIVLNVFVYRSFDFTTAANVFFFYFQVLIGGFSLFPHQKLEDMQPNTTEFEHC